VYLLVLLFPTFQILYIIRNKNHTWDLKQFECFLWIPMQWVKFCQIYNKYSVGLCGFHKSILRPWQVLMGLCLMSLNHWNKIQILYGHNLQTPCSKLTILNFLVEVDDMGIQYTNVLNWCNGWKQEATYAINSNKSLHFNGKLDPFCFRFTFKENKHESNRQSQTCILSHKHRK
jgi:hypothetical protein